MAGDPGRSSVYAMAIGQMTANSYHTQSASYIAALQDNLLGWRFIIIKKGYVGTVPNLARAGDVVAITKGGRVPFILWESTTRLRAFQLVGECYVHGMMNGEGFSLPGVVETTFRFH